MMIGKWLSLSLFSHKTIFRKSSYHHTITGQLYFSRDQQTEQLNWRFFSTATAQLIIDGTNTVADYENSFEKANICYEFLSDSTGHSWGCTDNGVEWTRFTLKVWVYFDRDRPCEQSTTPLCVVSMTCRTVEVHSILPAGLLLKIAPHPPQCAVKNCSPPCQLSLLCPL